MSDSDHGQASEGENLVNHGAGSDQVELDDNMDIDHDDAPVRFRSLAEVYEDAAEVELLMQR
jgi:hypothetical protein